MILRWPSWNVCFLLMYCSCLSWTSFILQIWEDVDLELKQDSSLFIFILEKCKTFTFFDQWQFVWLCTCWILSYLIVIIFHVLDVNKALHLVRVGAHATQHNHFVWDSTHTEIHEIDRTNNGDCVVLGPVEHHHHFPLQEDPCTAHRYSVCQANKH